MDRRIVNAAELDLTSPGRRDYWVALPRDGIWGDHLVPLTVFVGPEAQPGRGLVAFGSTHGNEYEGPMAIKHLLGEIDIARVRGRIILVPVLNVAAFRWGTRDSVNDDGVNLNRAFVDAAGRTPALGRITHRIADFVRTSIWPHVHVVFDMHAGGEVAQFALGPSFHPIPDPEQNRRIEETARGFGSPIVLVYQTETPGLLTSEAPNSAGAARPSPTGSASPATASAPRQSTGNSSAATSPRSPTTPMAHNGRFRRSIAAASPSPRSMVTTRR